MSKVIVVTDSNSGITPDEAKKLGVEVIPMPFYIDEQMYYENIDLTQEQFYEKLTAGGDIKTSMPLVGDVTDKWDELLKENDEIVYIPMSSGLSSSCETAYMLSQDYDGKVQVVNNQRISVTMRQSVIEHGALDRLPPVAFPHPRQHHAPDAGDPQVPQCGVPRRRAGLGLYGAPEGRRRESRHPLGRRDVQDPSRDRRGNSR